MVNIYIIWICCRIYVVMSVILIPFFLFQREITSAVALAIFAIIFFQAARLKRKDLKFEIVFHK